MEVSTLSSRPPTDREAAAPGLLRSGTSGSDAPAKGASIHSHFNRFCHRIRTEFRTGNSGVAHAAKPLGLLQIIAVDAVEPNVVDVKILSISHHEAHVRHGIPQGIPAEVVPSAIGGVEILRSNS